jgi:hypothetical protein
VLAAIVSFATPAFADDHVSGLITRTYVIVEDTALVGNVTCEVANNTPCFSFGAPNVELRLDGSRSPGAATRPPAVPAAPQTGKPG